MPRVKQVSRAEITAPIMVEFYNKMFGDRDPVKDPGTGTGTVGDWWTVFALSQPVFEHAVNAFRSIGVQNPPGPLKLSAQLREIATIRATYLAETQFCFSQHMKTGRREGLSEELMADIQNWGVSSRFSDAERAVLAYTDCLVSQLGRTPDGVFDALKKHLSDQEIVELSYVVTIYLSNAIMCRALKLEFDNIPERIVEVPKPEGGGVAKWR
jgi:alkylhydroperoxidase family enzyme